MTEQDEREHLETLHLEALLGSGRPMLIPEMDRLMELRATLPPPSETHPSRRPPQAQPPQSSTHHQTMPEKSGRVFWRGIAGYLGPPPGSLPGEIRLVLG